MNLPTHLQEGIEQAARTQSDKYKREMVKVSTDLDCINESAESYYQGYKDGAEDFSYLIGEGGRIGKIAGIWRPVTRKEDCPPDDGYDEPTTYIMRCKGDDPRSGWVAVLLRTSEQMWYAASQFEYAEWLDTETPVVAGCAELVRKAKIDLIWELIQEW